jgi:hypothetical protein
MTQLRRLTLLALCSLGLHCGGRNQALEQPLALLEEPVALDDQLVFVDTQGHRAFMLKVTGARPEDAAREVELPHEPSVAVRRNHTNEALVLCLGQRASSEAAEDATLTALESNGTLRRYVLKSRFDTLVQSDDGQYAFLFKSDIATRLLENPNEVAIVDLNQDPAKKNNTAVHLRNLRSFGDSPLSVTFSPTMRILDEDRRLAVVLSKTNVTLIDLAHLDRLETTVQLSDPGGQAVAPTQVMFSPDTPELYVRGSSSNDVFVFNLSARPGDDPTADGQAHNDFRPSIDQLGVGGRPSDMALYGSGSGARLLVLAADTQEASVVDASTSQVTSVSLPNSASKLLLFDATSPHDSQIATRALLYQPNASALMFLDLADLETRGSRNLEQLALERPIVKVIPMLEEHLALVIHDTGGVSLVDLAGRTVSPIRSTAPLQDALFDAARHRLWVGPSGQDRLGWLDLETGATHELPLDTDIQRVVPMFGKERVAVVHDSSVGYVTVLNATDPKRETATSLRGFLIAGLLERDP